MGKDCKKPNKGNKGRSSNFSETHNKPDAKKSVEDYCFYISSVTRASDYDVTSQFIINCIKKIYVRGNNVAEALRAHVNPDMTKWKPELMLSVPKDAAIKIC